ncbi:Protein of unknown function [Gryllus bimaculatus]|nr:Protein of unknown function [Gryllus bimaculatus]
MDGDQGPGPGPGSGAGAGAGPGLRPRGRGRRGRRARCGAGSSAAEGLHRAPGVAGPQKTSPTLSPTPEAGAAKSSNGTTSRKTKTVSFHSATSLPTERKISSGRPTLAPVSLLVASSSADHTPRWPAPNPQSSVELRQPGPRKRRASQQPQEKEAAPQNGPTFSTCEPFRTENCFRYLFHSHAKGYEMVAYEAYVT